MKRKFASSSMDVSLPPLIIPRYLPIQMSFKRNSIFIPEEIQRLVKN